MDSSRLFISGILFWFVCFAYHYIPWYLIFLTTAGLDIWEVWKLQKHIYSFHKIYIVDFLWAYIIILNCITFLFLKTRFEQLFTLVILVSISDANQYVFGVTCGKNKVNRGPSPHKTWEGYIGALVTMICGLYLTNLRSSCIIVSSGVLGDLVMSAIKRQLKIKDTSTLLYSHGGWLDRTDGIKMAILISYILC